MPTMRQSRQNTAENTEKSRFYPSNGPVALVQCAWIAIILVVFGFLPKSIAQAMPPVRILGGAPVGTIAVGNSPEEFAAFVQAEITRWAKVVKFSGARPE